MNKEYKFLVLEDVESDAELVMDEVRNSGLNCSFKWVENEPDFIKALDEFLPDLILSDYSLPTYDGMSALKYVLKHSPNTPVILVTGSVNEETAVLCMKTGAVDYVLKDKMSRLGLAVITALKNKQVEIERKQVKLDLEKSERYYRSVLKYMHDEIVVISKDYIITDINNSVLKLTGEKKSDILGKPCYKILKNLDSPCFNHGIECYHDQVMSNGKIQRYQQKSVNLDGTKSWMDVIVSPLYDVDNNITHIIESYRDITKLTEAKNQIEKLSTVVEQSPLSIIIMNLDWEIEYVNKMFKKLYGYSLAESQSKGLEIFHSGNTDIQKRARIKADILNGKHINEIFHNFKKTGQDFWVKAAISPFRNSEGEIVGVLQVLEDISQTLKDQKQIEEDLREKELLLQEIYHRVNNNMQIMISLINMQINRIDNESEKIPLLSAQSKIAAMSAIYNDIFQERSFVAINFKSVIINIFNNLIDSAMLIPENITLYVETSVPEFGLDLAQPCALIVNELLSNCIKYAYPDGNGKIYVDLTIDEDEEILLSVKDNGIGIPEHINPLTAETGGFSLVNMLGQGQLGGVVKFIENNGTTAELKFKRIIDQKRF